MAKAIARTAPMSILVLLLLSEAATMASASDASVNIYNELPGDNLFVHCKSGTDDLGEHMITPGSFFGWGFKHNYWGTTLFWCVFGTGSGSSYRSQKFDVWTDTGFFSNVHHKCNWCEWHVKADGFYLNDVNKPQAKVGDWENGECKACH